MYNTDQFSHYIDSSIKRSVVPILWQNCLTSLEFSLGFGSAIRQRVTPTYFAKICSAFGNSLALFIGTTKTYPLSDARHCIQVNPQELDALQKPAFLVTKKISVLNNGDILLYLSILSFVPEFWERLVIEFFWKVGWSL